MKKLLHTLALLIVPFCAHTQVLPGEITMLQTHKDWGSFLVSAGGETRARAVTFAKEANQHMVVVDFFSGTCDQIFAVYFYLGSAATHDHERNDVVLSLRADSGKRFDLPATSSITMGDKTGLVTLNYTPEFFNIISEMKRGYSLRTKIMFGGDEQGAIYLTFSLHGFIAAHTRAQELCSKTLPRDRRSSGDWYDDL